MRPSLEVGAARPTPRFGYDGVMSEKRPTLDDALHTPLEAVLKDCVNGNPSGLEMIRLLRARVQELEDAVEAALRHTKSLRAERL